MGRFLIYFSYFGTRYSGVQEQRGVTVKGNSVKTVGGALRKALMCLQPSNEMKITLSSRTDKGVHAIKNAFHVDLVHPFANKEYSPFIVTNVMNNCLKEQEEDIRVLQTLQVPDTFSARQSAVGRKYVYRMGHIPGSGMKSNLHYIPFDSESFLEETKIFTCRRPHGRFPLAEPLSTLDACKAVIYRTPLDISKLISAAEMVSGIHNYLSFTSKRKEDADYLPHPVKMLTIGVKRGQPFGHILQRCGLDVAENAEFWDIHVQSRSFMYRQVRRLVGAMVLVARNSITLGDLQDILDNPKKDFPYSCQMVASESGLFLCDVEYNPKDLELVQTAQVDVAVDQSQVIQISYAAASTLSCDSSGDTNDSDIDPNPTDSVVATDDRELSEDDITNSSLPGEKIISQVYKSTERPEEVPECS